MKILLREILLGGEYYWAKEKDRDVRNTGRRVVEKPRPKIFGKTLCSSYKGQSAIIRRTLE